MIEEKESKIELLNRLQENGDLKKLVDSGIVSPRFIIWRNMYIAYQFRLEAVKSKMQAMEEVSMNFKRSIQLVAKVRRFFE